MAALPPIDKGSGNLEREHISNGIFAKLYEKELSDVVLPEEKLLLLEAVDNILDKLETKMAAYEKEAVEISNQEAARLVSVNHSLNELDSSLYTSPGW